MLAHVLSTPILSKLARPGSASANAAGSSLSYSQARMFTGCPLQWRLSRDYAPTFVSASLVFGGGIHAAAETFYRACRQGKAATLAEMLDAYDQYWNQQGSGQNPPVRFTAKLEDAAGMRELANRMLTAFLAAAHPGEVVSAGEAFTVELAPDLPPITGRIDWLEIRRSSHNGKRRLHLVNLKTAARRPTAEDIDRDRMILYALAAQKAGWAKIHGLPLTTEVRFITKTKSPETVTIPVEVTPHDSVRLTEKVRQCHRAMVAGVCYPAPSWACATCGYSAQCKSWPTLPAVTERKRPSLFAA